MKFSPAVCLLAAATCLPLCAQAQAYKCKQANGHTSYQEQPCAPSEGGKSVTLRDPSPASGDPAPGKTPAPAARPVTRNDPNARADAEQRARLEQLEAQNRANRCAQARSNLGALKTQRPVYSFDKNGEKQYVDDSQRESAIAAAQRDVAANCR